MTFTFYFSNTSLSIILIKMTSLNNCIVDNNTIIKQEMRFS
jgi:hypothetical protein